MTYTRVADIGTNQVGGVHHHCLPGNYLGFTCGLQSTGSMEAALNAFDAFTGGYSESVAFGLPNQMGTPNLAPLAGISRFVVFNVPMVPHAVHSGDTVGSIAKLLSGTYDAQIDATAAAVTALGLGKRQAVRIGEEYNSGAGDGPTQGFEWATKHSDWFAGGVNGISQYKLGAAYVENRWRAQGYPGFAAWSLGTTDTSALSAADAMPTHGDPNLTLLDFDLYPGPPWNGDKNTLSQFTSKVDGIYDGYVAFCKANGLLMAHSEIGQIGSPKSPFTYNDIATWWPWLYNKIAVNAATLAWAIGYWQNQGYVAPGGSPVVLTESHQIALSVVTSGGAPGGSAATTPWTGNYPPGTSGPNVSGSANTAANTGSLFNSSDAGLHWIWSPDPTKTNSRTSWQATFGGVGSANGLGAQGLTVAIQPDVPGQTTTAQLALSTNHRGQLAVFA